MASTYNSIKIELINTGEQTGQWGNTTNTNLGTALTEAITGSVDVVFASADVTLPLVDTNASQSARNLRLNLIGVSGGARQLIVPAIEKQYIITNNLADTVTVKNSTGTGVAVPAGRTVGVFNDATNVSASLDCLPTLALTTPLAASSGGTGLAAPGAAGNGLISNGTIWTSAPSSGGSVASVSVVSANGLAGTVATATSTPAITLSTTVTGVLKGNGTALSAAVSGTDYVAPSAYASANGLTMATAKLLGRYTGGTGAAQEITVGSGLTLSAGTLVASGTSGVSTFSAGSTGLTPSSATAGAITLGGTLATGSGGTGSSSLAGAGIATYGGSGTFSNTIGFSGAFTLFSTPVVTTGTGNFSIGSLSSPSANWVLYAKANAANPGGVFYNETSNGTCTLHVLNGTAGYLAAYAYGAIGTYSIVGNVTTNGSSVAYNTTSDYRLKENIAPMTGALAAVSQLKPVTYSWKANGSVGQGFIAHELAEVVPDCVNGEKDATREEDYDITPAVPAVVNAEGVETTPAVPAVKGTRTVPAYQGVDTSFLVATLTAAIQELKAISDAQAARITALEAK